MTKETSRPHILGEDTQSPDESRFRLSADEGATEPQINSWLHRTKEAAAPYLFAVVALSQAAIALALSHVSDEYERYAREVAWLRTQRNGDMITEAELRSKLTTERRTHQANLIKAQRADELERGDD